MGVRCAGMRLRRRRCLRSISRRMLFTSLHSVREPSLRLTISSLTPDVPCSRRSFRQHEIQSTPQTQRHLVRSLTRTQLTFYRDNTLINDNILYTAHTSGVQKVISCLSTCVYPDKVEYPLDETKIHLGLPHESNFGYAHAKRMVDVANQ